MFFSLQRGSIMILMRRQTILTAGLLIGIILKGPAAIAAEPTGGMLDPTAPNLRRTVIVQVVEKTKDAVVNISTTKKVYDPYWLQFNQGVLVPANSLGSG